ncbi:MAG TPA: CD225/dispanin family protein [Opitutaceae bacterium]|nr:CD225/dispanin family protein [Opitutaceae bacterium]
MDYHVARNNQKLGVFPEAEVRTRLQSGELLPNDLVWCEGMSAWRPAAEVFPEASTTPPPVPAAPSIPPPPRPTPVALGPKPSNYLVPAILVTLFCCLPFGIASIVFASQVDSKYAAGDLAGAQQSSDKAKFWMWLSVGGALLIGIAYIGIMVFGIAMGGLAH